MIRNVSRFVATVSIQQLLAVSYRYVYREEAWKKVCVEENGFLSSIKRSSKNVKQLLVP